MLSIKVSLSLKIGSNLNNESESKTSDRNRVVLRDQAKSDDPKYKSSLAAETQEALTKVEVYTSQTNQSLGLRKFS